MCMPIRQPRREIVFVRPTRMWKVVRKDKPDDWGENRVWGPYHPTQFKKDGWALSCPPRGTVNFTRFGYHVFVSKRGAEQYLEKTVGEDRYKIFPVMVMGKALEFAYKPNRFASRPGYKGFAVQYWKPVEERKTA